MHIICQALRKTNKFYKWLKPILLLLTYAGFFLLCRYFAEQFFAEIKWVYLYIAIFALVLSVAAVLLTNRVDKVVMEKLLFFAAVIAITVLIAQCLNLALNAMWTRQRFRNLAAGNYPGGSTEGFNPWYKPTFGKNDQSALFTDAEGKDDSDAYNSFVNAQTLGVTAAFSVIVLPDLFEKLRKYKVWFFVAPIILTVMTAIANIINRNAYLSDVLFAAAIGVGCVYIAKIISRLMLKKSRVIASALASIDNADVTKEEAE